MTKTWGGGIFRVCFFDVRQGAGGFFVLGITDMKLTSYVSRHTMAMTLQDNQVPREVISQILGHSDLATTNTYLDSFGSSVIDEAVKVL